MICILWLFGCLGELAFDFLGFSQYLFVYCHLFLVVGSLSRARIVLIGDSQNATWFFELNWSFGTSVELLFPELIKILSHWRLRTNWQITQRYFFVAPLRNLVICLVPIRKHWSWLLDIDLPMCSSRGGVLLLLGNGILFLEPCHTHTFISWESGLIALLFGILVWHTWSTDVQIGLNAFFSFLVLFLVLLILFWYYLSRMVHSICIYWVVLSDAYCDIDLLSVLWRTFLQISLIVVILNLKLLF